MIAWSSRSPMWLSLVGVDRDDDRGVLLLADLEDAVEHRLVADVERRDREVVVVGDVEQVLAVEQHCEILLVCGVERSGLTAASALHRAGGEPADEVALEEEEEDEHRDAAEDAHRHHLVPLVRVLAHEQLDADRARCACRPCA